MTNEELDRWLATDVMGWRDRVGNWERDDERVPYLVADPDPDPWDGGVCGNCDWWHPTTNIAQAIEAAEKARADRRTGSWILESPTEGDPSWQARVLSKHEFGATPAEAISRALYAALSETA